MARRRLDRVAAQAQAGEAAEHPGVDQVVPVAAEVAPVRAPDQVVPVAVLLEQPVAASVALLVAVVVVPAGAEAPRVPSVALEDRFAGVARVSARSVRNLTRCRRRRSAEFASARATAKQFDSLAVRR